MKLVVALALIAACGGGSAKPQTATPEVAPESGGAIQAAGLNEEGVRHRTEGSRRN